MAKTGHQHWDIHGNDPSKTLACCLCPLSNSFLGFQLSCCDQLYWLHCQGMQIQHKKLLATNWHRKKLWTAVLLNLTWIFPSHLPPSQMYRIVLELLAGPNDTKSLSTVSCAVGGTDLLCAGSGLCTGQGFYIRPERIVRKMSLLPKIAAMSQVFPPQFCDVEYNLPMAWYGAFPCSEPK